MITRSSTWTAFIVFAASSLLLLAACSDSEPPEEPTAIPAASEAPTQAPTITPVPTTEPPSPTRAPADTPMPTEVATSTPGPTPVPTAEPTAAPEPASDTYPLEIVDMLGTTVTIPAQPARIVTISPTATEILYIAGGKAIARDSSSTFPEETLELPDLGGAYSPSFEAIAAQGADLILIEALTQARFTGAAVTDGCARSRRSRCFPV